MNPTAVKEAVKNNFPMEKFVNVWWASGDDDARAGEAGAKGFKTLNWHAAGADFGVIKDIQKFVVDKGKSQAAKDKIGDRSLQPRRLQLDADRRSDPHRAEDHRQEGGDRRGRPSRAGGLNVDAARLKEMGMEGFAAPMKVTCERPQRPPPGLRAAVGRHQVGEGLRLDRADEGQGAAAARGRRQGLCREERRLAEAHGSLRRQVVRRTCHPRRSRKRSIGDPAA